MSKQLSYPEKLELLSDLRDFYMKDFGMVYDDTPEELGQLKGLSIGLVLDSIKTFFKGNNEPSKDEIISVLTYVLNKDFLDEIYNGKDEKALYFIKTGFGCAVGILLGDKKVIKVEKKELEKAGGIEIKCNLI